MAVNPSGPDQAYVVFASIFEMERIIEFPTQICVPTALIIGVAGIGGLAILRGPMVVIHPA